MSARLSRGIWFFLIFFLIGLGAYIFIGQVIIPSKPIVSEENDITYSSRISDVAGLVSPSIVGVTNLKRNFDWYEPITESTGSGVILNNDGYIVTNNHVVKDADKIIVTLADGNEEEAKIIGRDPRTDLAVIKVKVDNYVTPIKFGDSDKLIVGEEVVAIGNPLGLRFARSVTAGIVSGLNRLLTTEEGFAFRLIQTDAAINPGNSGGALVNLKGELVGINTVKIAMEGFEGMGFSIPSNQVKLVVEDIKKNGRVVRPAMGVTILREFSCDVSKFFNFPGKCGVAIAVIKGSPAQEAGLKNYDIITKIDDVETETGLILQELIGQKKAGDTIKVEYIRMSNLKGEKSELRTTQLVLENL